MKTIRQIAEEIGVSRQAVYKKIKREPLSTSLQPFLSTVNNVIYSNVDGEMLIKSAFNKTVSIDKNDNQEPYVHNNVHIELIKLLVNSIDNLKSQIEELTTTIGTQAENVNKPQQNKSYYPKKKTYKVKKRIGAESAPMKRLMGNGL